MTAAAYPEHEKLQKIVDKSQAIGEFLDWLQQEKGIHLAEYRQFPELRDPVLTPTYTRPDDLLAEFFDIDRAKIEQEKRAMIDAMRKAVGDTDA